MADEQEIEAMQDRIRALRVGMHRCLLGVVVSSPFTLMLGPLWLNVTLSLVCAGLLAYALKLQSGMYRAIAELEALSAREEAARLARLRELTG